MLKPCATYTRGMIKDFAATEIEPNLQLKLLASKTDWSLLQPGNAQAAACDVTLYHNDKQAPEKRGLSLLADVCSVGGSDDVGWHRDI